jgi:hypothetical protein
VRRSSKVTLVLLGVAALAGCSRSDEQRSDLYASREDCLADWGNTPDDCKPATDPNHAARGFWMGPMYSYSSGFWGSGWGGTTHSSGHSIGSTSSSSSSSGGVSRGGFGSTGSARGSSSSS